MKRFLLSALSVLVFMAMSAQEHLIFTRISQSEGLTSTVNCIYKEKDGDVWLGCPSALYQFNGHTLLQREDAFVEGKGIYQMSTDEKGNLWVLTDDWLLQRRKGEELFKPVRLEEMPDAEAIFSLCMDSKGVWFGATDKVFRYTYSDGRFFLFSKFEDEEYFDIRQIQNFNENTLLCSSHKGIVFIDKASGKVSKAPFGSRKEISAFIIDSKGRIWLGIYNNGIEVYEKSGKLIKRYDSSNSRLSNNIVLCMTEKDSSIWAGTDGGGINIIDMDTDSITVLSHISGDDSSFPAHSIKSLYTDYYGNMWAGSIRDGAIRISSSGISSYRDCHIGLNSGLSNPTVVSLYQDKESDYIWIGTDGEGLNRLNPRNGKFTHYLNTLKTKVVSIASYSENELALSLYGDKIQLFNKKTGALRDLTINDEDLLYQIRYSTRAINLYNEADGTLLLMSNNIKRLNQKNGKFELISKEDKTLAQGNYFPIGLSNEGLWLHDSKGLYLLRTGENILEPKGEIHDQNIRCGDIGKDGIIWLATSKGLQKFDTRNGVSSHIHTTLFDSAMSVTCDRIGRVWIGTEEHLYAYIIDTDNFILFGESNGAKDNEYLSKPHLLSREGDVFLGGVMGLVHIEADFSTKTPENPTLKLYELLIDNKKVKAENGAIVNIPRNSKSLKLSIAAQEKDIFRHKVYRFMLPDESNIYETETPILELQKLPSPGKYEVFVSCTKRNGNWSEPVRILSLHVPLPWFLSWWFILISLSLLAIITGTIFIIVYQKKEASMQMALKEQEQRLYEEKVALLINMSHELRSPLTLIMAPLKRMLGNMKPGQENFETLNRVYRQSRRMKDLLNMALDLRKMEVGKSSMKMERYDFNKWLSETTEDIVSEEMAEGITIVRELDPALSFVCFDKAKCDTIILNILINAIKHSKKGDSIYISSRLMENGFVRVSVSDMGPGLSDIDLSKMFSQFYQSKNEQYGSGLGLAYAKILVELHGGSIGAENKADGGAIFWWEIPLEPKFIEAANIPSRAYLNELMGYDPGDIAAAPESDDFSTAGMTLMLVDDNRDLLEFLREALCSEFKSIILAESGNKAMEAIRQDKLPDMIISDINMPDGDGYRLCKQLKSSEKYSHIPIMLLTARGEEQSQSDSYRMGADGYLAKPFEVETLMEMIKGILRRRAEIRKKYLDIEDETAENYGSNEEAFIIRFNKIVEEHISDPELDQQILCRELGVSRALLYNKMKAITGAGAKEYITRIRLEKAKHLIETTSLNIAEISDKCGFASQSYFSTAFKAYTGMTPSRYKTEARR